jgi:tetratricopeptide (TPR) repeat protein
MSTVSDGVDITNERVELAGLRIALVGRLAGMPKREAQQLIRQRGGLPVELATKLAPSNLPLPRGEGRGEGVCMPPDTESVRNSAPPHWIVVGENLAECLWQSDPQAKSIDSAGDGDAGAPDPQPPLFDRATQAAIESGQTEVLSESEFWQRLGLVDDQEHIHRLYTPAMLAQLVGVQVAVVRRWHRRGLIKPVREVRRLPYFDFQEVATARRLAELLAGGVSPAAIERKLAELARYVPGAERPLAQLSVIVRGSRLLLRQGDGLIGPGGQLFFDFDTTEHATDAADGSALRESTEARATISLADALRSGAAPPETPDELLALAADLEDEGDLAAAVEAYRAYAAAVGPAPSVCFAMAELLYRLGDTAAARERYYMAIELDEDYVEARANLGCVLAELGERELAAAAFEGALSLHADYADAHFHLARTLDEFKRADEAAHHWREFLRLAPESPWAAAARERLAAPQAE